MQRLKKILKWTAIVLGATIAVLLAWNAWYVWSTGTQLEKRMAELREAGEPLQLADLARPPIPPATNAATYLRRAAADLAAIEKELYGWYPEGPMPPVPVPAADRERLGKLMAAYPNVWPLLEQAAACRDYDPEIDYSVSGQEFVARGIAELSRHRSAFRVMRARAAWLLSQGRGDEALQSMLVVLRLSRLLRNEPMVIGYLLVVACENTAISGVNDVLQSGPISPESRKALDAELALHDNCDAHRWALRSERAGVLSAMRDLPLYGFWPARGMSNAGTLRVLEFFDKQSADAARPFADVAAEEKAAAPPARSANMYMIVVRLLEPAVKAAREPAERVRANSRALRVINAIQAQGTPGGATPELAKLGLPDEATRDPYNGQPLKIKRLGSGWKVYSVGKNLVDDGGKSDDASDVGFGPIAPTR